ncbi:MAG: glutamate racemase [bacterium]|nr:glutamate racemase [bacterium]
MNNGSIGIFDSGFGGLTVLSEVAKLFTKENIIYFGDVARSPYGPKSKETIIKYALEISKFLFNQGVKIIVIACNTASSCALEVLQEEYSIPIIGVIQPGAEEAVRITKNYKIGVIGTEGTINNNVYNRIIKSLNKEMQVVSQPCPLFVSLVEEGWVDTEVTHLIAKEYLSSLKENQVDTLILGCTHYPLLKDVIQKVMGKDVFLIDSATTVANKVKSILEEQNILSSKESSGNIRFYVSDEPSRFVRIGERFLDKEIRVITQIDISGMLEKGR